MALKQARVITITSTKGGAGKTLTAINIAALLSNKTTKVLIIDMDLYSSGVAIALNANNEKDIYKLVYDIKNNSYTTFEDYVDSYDENIFVLPAPKDPRLANKIGIKYVEMVIGKAKPKYDYIIIDTNHILNDLNLMTLDNSDMILYLINNDITSLKNMRTLVSIYSDMEKTNYKIILNNSLNENKGKFTNYDIENIINHKIDFTLSRELYISNIQEYYINGKIPALDKKKEKKYRCLEDLLFDLTGNF